MLARAVQQDNASSAVKGPQKSRDIANALKPSPPSLINASLPRWTGLKNPLKRTASQAYGGSVRSNKQGQMTQILPEQQSSSKYRSDGATAVVGMVEKLHANVYFDENDFEDDADIDLNNEEPAPASQDISYPTLPSYPATLPASRIQGSSQPIPWSSSPMHHRLPPERGADKDKAQELSSNSEAMKRRTIPWLHEPANDHDHPAMGDHAKKSVRHEQATDSTPISKDRLGSPYAWNKTASDFKEEQRKFRQGHKKLIKDNEVKDIAKTIPTKPVKMPKRVFLSEEQRRVLDLVTEKRKSAFFTGSAGTGKSVLLLEIIKSLRVKYQREPDRVAVTASTGLAACNIGGVTLHSFAGIGLGKEAVPELVRKIKRNVKAKNRWLRTKVLIIDEISMVDGDLFDKLEGVARTIRNNGRPFGGIQLVITGDFFQLPPVPDHGKTAKFCFDGATWSTSIEHTIGLTQVFRQKDPVFANMLNEMRLGRLTESSINAFRSLYRPLGFKDDFEATELFPTRNEVDNANNARMRNLGGKAWDFKAEDGGSITDVSQRDKLLSNCIAPQFISLKKGAQVMLIKNIDETLVNGSIGKVIAFMDEKTFDYYHDDEDDFQAIESAKIGDAEMTESRKKLQKMMNKDLISDTSQMWPLVRFAISDGSTRDLLCQRESWKIELPNGEIQASRSQIPLILAWALSIHKAQGQTLERVKVDLGKIFEKGQAYVALSRATCQEGLQIMRFDPRKVMAHERVRTFYNGLYKIEWPDAARATKYEDIVESKDLWDDTDAMQALHADI